MRGRKKVPKFETIKLEGDPKDIQRQNSEINFMAADITVMAQQPGLGKTHSVIQFCKENPDKKILYLTTRHRLIEEITADIPNASHWYGFGYHDNGVPKGCPKFHIPKVQKLYEAGLGASIICRVMGCDQSKCRYHQQFGRSDIVFAPVDYINTKYIRNNDKFRFDICFIDESILKTKEIKFSME